MTPSDVASRTSSTTQTSRSEAHDTLGLKMTSGVFTANAVWLVAATMAFNLARAAATLTASPHQPRATTPTIRRKLINLPARIASSARRLHLHLPQDWPWQDAWTAPYEALRRGRVAAPAWLKYQSLRAGPPVERPGRPATPARPHRRHSLMRPPPVYAPSFTSSSVDRG